MKILLLLSAIPIASAFAPATPLARQVPLSHMGLMMMPQGDDEQSTTRPNKPPSVPLAAATFWALTSSTAMAADWGIFEGKTLSLLHPAMMAGMLGLSVSTALLGFDWRRQRTIGDEISALKKQIPNLGASSVAGSMAAAQAAEDTMQGSLAIEAQIKDLQNERKTLSEKGAREKHFSQGSLLVFLGTLFAIEGPLNTYARTGKLFPGPHLYAGAGLVCLWALASACVPAMQKGDDTARTVHIGANLAGIGLFVWQVQSGIPILLKVWQFAPWP